MGFKTWIKQQTGLSLYDFRVLDLDATSENQVRSLFDTWQKNCCPSLQAVEQAINDAACEGFEVA